MIISPVPMPSTGGDPEFNESSLQKQAALAGVFRQAADEMGCAFAAAEEWIGPELLGEDRCHFLEQAHTIFAQRVAGVIRELLE